MRIKYSRNWLPVAAILACVRARAYNYTCTCTRVRVCAIVLPPERFSQQKAAILLGTAVFTVPRYVYTNCKSIFFVLAQASPSPVKEQLVLMQLVKELLLQLVNKVYQVLLLRRPSCSLLPRLFPTQWGLPCHRWPSRSLLHRGICYTMLITVL